MARLKLRTPNKPNVEGAGFKENIKLEKTGNKVETNQQQSDNKQETYSILKWQQTDSKLATENFIKKETGNKVVSQPATEAETKWQQTDNKLATNLNIVSLIGLQRRLLFFLFENCKSVRSNATGPITLGYLSELSKSPSGSVKVTLQRLEKKQFIVRKMFKNGRGGWSIYEIPDGIYNMLLKMETDNKLATNQQQTGNKVVSQPATEPATSLSSSSSYLDNIKSTTTSEFEPELIDSSPLRIFGFGINHVKQCLERNWGFDKHPIELQQSIFHIKTAIDKGILAIPKGPGLIMEQLKRGKYHAPDSIKANEAEFSVEKAMPWWDGLSAEHRIELQKKYNFDRMKNNEEKRVKIAEIYQENIRDVGSEI